MAADAAAELSRPAHLVGLSMGGYVSLARARARAAARPLALPDRHRSGGPNRVPRPPHIRKACEEAARSARRVRAGDDAALARARLAPGEPRRFEEIIAARVSDGATLDTMWAHLEACYGYYSAGVPVELIESTRARPPRERGRRRSPENGRMLAARFPNAEYLELPGVGHNLPLEIPEEVAQRVDSWVKLASL